jgi:hypothetical protein
MALELLDPPLGLAAGRQQAETDRAVIADRLLDRPQSFIKRFLARGSQWIIFSLSGSAAERLSDLLMAPARRPLHLLLDSDPDVAT